MQPLHIMLDFTRTRNANDPYGFQFGRQTYVCKVDGRGAHTITIDWNDELLADLDSLGSDRCDANTPQRVGNQLRDILKATDWPVSQQLVVDAIGTSPPRPVRVTVVSDAAEIYALPWELLALDSGEHLGLLPSVLVRYAWHGRRRVLPANAASKPGRILLAWSESHGVVPHGEHWRVLYELAAPTPSTTPRTLRWGAFAARRDEVARVSYDRLGEALATSNHDEPVSILHLLCHGVSQGNAVGLGFHDGDGDGNHGQAVIHGGDLRELLGPHAHHLRVVVLAACHSGDSRLLNNELGSIAQNLHRAGIETVIASRMPLSIAGSVKFAKAFYGALGNYAANAKDAAEHAFLQARRAVAPSNDRYSLQLYARPEEQDKAEAHRRPNYQDGATQQRSEQLEEAYRRRETLREAGLDTADVNKDILALKRALREGGQLKAGDILGEGRYLLSRRVGHGGFAVVWEAWDTQNQEVVAIKVLHSNLAGDELRRQRFFRGARMMASLDHEAVVRVREPHGHDGGYHYFVMEFVSGGNVDEAVMAGCLPSELAYGLLYRLSHVLAEIHQKGMVHRDIKPQNILLTDAGEAKLADFDLVAAKDSTGGTRTGALGTLLYAAPEMLDRPQEADARADVYGLGMTALFVLHGGRLPYEVLMGDKAGFIGKLPVKKALAKVLKKATATSPADRYQNASELHEALLMANPAIIVERGKRKPARAAAAPPWRMAGAVAAVVVSAVIAVSDWSLSGDEEGPIASVEEDRGAIGSEEAANQQGMTERRDRITLTGDIENKPRDVDDGKNLRPKMVGLSGGTFWMGTEGEEGDDDEKPRHEVTISAFEISETEVTQGQWERLMGNNPSNCRYGCGDNLPVNVVSWYDAVEYLNKLSEHEGLIACYKGPRESIEWNRSCTGYRLPTEAEWEYAARAGSESAYSFGDDAAKLDEYAWYNENAGRKVHAVASKRANRWGLYDMHGNVLEWVWDRYGAYSEKSVQDPTGTKVGAARVVRGGSFLFRAGNLRSAYRVRYLPGLRVRFYGFRVARGGPRALSH